jgi:hypothetical protein
MKRTDMIHMHRIARRTGALLAAVTISSCSLEGTPDAAPTQRSAAEAEVATRRAKEGTGRSVLSREDESQAVGAADGEPAAASDPMAAAAAAPLTAAEPSALEPPTPCSTPDVIPPPEPALAAAAIVLPEQEETPVDVPSDEEVRAHQVAVELPLPSEQTRSAQEQYLREATTMRDQMGAADPAELDARLAERKAELLRE